jgi:hypothetical protein
MLYPMPYTPDNMNNKFSEDSKHEMPPGLDWESMEAGILSKMRSMQAERSKPRVWFFLSIPVFAVILVGAYFSARYFLRDSTEQIGHSSAHTAPFIPEVNEGETNSITRASPPSSAPLSASPKGTSSLVDAVQNPTVRSNESSTNERVNENLKAFRAQNSDTLLRGSNAYTSVGGDDNRHHSLASDSSSKRPRVEPLVDSILAKNDLAQISLETHKDSAHGRDVRAQRTIAKNTGLRYGFESGLSVWTNASNPTDWRNQSYTSPQVSHQFQGYVQKAVGRSTFVMAAVQFQQLNSRLEYHKTLVNYNLILTDTVVRVNRDLVTGQLEKVYGDVNEVTTAQRIVIHYNASRTFKGSLGFGHNLSFRGVHADVYYGMSVTGFAHHMGRTVWNDEVVDINPGQTNVINTQLALDAVAGSRVYYQLNSTASLTCGVQIQQSMVNWSAIDARALYPLSVGLNVGVSINPFSK